MLITKTSVCACLQTFGFAHCKYVFCTLVVGKIVVEVFWQVRVWLLPAAASEFAD